MLTFRFRHVFAHNSLCPHLYLWRGSDDTILGKPVYTSPYIPEIETGRKPIVFGDITFYWRIERGGVTLKALHEKYAANGVTGYIGTEFIDGRFVKREAVKALVMAEELGR